MLTNSKSLNLRFVWLTKHLESDCFAYEYIYIDVNPFLANACLPFAKKFKPAKTKFEHMIQKLPEASGLGNLTSDTGQPLSFDLEIRLFRLRKRPINTI